MNSENRSARKGTLAAWGAVLVAVVSSACCWLPLLLLFFGFSGGVVAAKFESLRPVLVPVTFILLALGWYFTLKPVRGTGSGACAATTDGGESCCPPQQVGKLPARKFNLVMLTVATLMTMAFAFFPNYLGAIVSAGSDPGPNAGQHVSQTFVLGIEGMTCAGCEVTVTKSLEAVPGVVVTDVDHQAGQATGRVPEGTDGELLRQAVEDLGYTVTDIEME